MGRLIDYFLVMHNLTMIRAHGKPSMGTGQYRSCMFPKECKLEQIALDAVADCRKQLGKILRTEAILLALDLFWVAEDRHQLRNERVKRKTGKDVETLSEINWLLEYGRRSDAIFGSS